MRMDSLIRPLISAMAVAAGLATPSPARAADCTPRDTVAVTLTTTGDPSKKIADDCYMPVVATDDKTLCGHDIAAEHTFTFVLTNQCAVDVKLKLTVKRGSVDFKGPECDFDKGNVLFEDYIVGNGAPVTKTCASRTHGNKGQKKGRYDVTATAVRIGGTESKVDVSFDPEIIIEDNGKGRLLRWGALVLLAAGIAYALYRVLRRS